VADPIIPPRRGEFLTPDGVATNRFNEYLERITRQTNTITDDTENADTINQNSSAISSLNKKINDLQLSDISQSLAGFVKKMSVVNVSADYTSVGNETIICTNITPITITLNAIPNNEEMVNIKRVNGAVIILGQTDGQADTRINKRYTSLHLIYTDAAGERSII
jgi:hypothetical protein